MVDNMDEAKLALEITKGIKGFFRILLPLM